MTPNGRNLYYSRLRFSSLFLIRHGLVVFFVWVWCVCRMMKVEKKEIFLSLARILSKCILEFDQECDFIKKSFITLNWRAACVCARTKRWQFKSHTHTAHARTEITAQPNRAYAFLRFPFLTGRKAAWSRPTTQSVEIDALLIQGQA